MGRQAKRSLAVLVGVLALALPVGDAEAAGGADIASAPMVAYGQHTFGTTATGSYQKCYPAEYWTLAMKAGDQVTIDWTASSRNFAYKAIIYPAGTTDFSINNVEGLGYYFLGSNNHAEAIFKTGTAGSFPLIFVGEGCSGPTPGPYDFTATVQHALTISLKSYTHIRTTTTISASASLVDGTPVPDGMAFNLTVTWPNPNHESALYTATSSGGAFSFPLALPESAKGKKATLIASRGPDPQFLGAESAKIEAQVGKGAPPVVVTPCEVATRRAHALARQHHRLVARARSASGPAKRRLRRRAHRVGGKLRAARANAASACASA